MPQRAGLLASYSDNDRMNFTTAATASSLFCRYVLVDMFRSLKLWSSSGSQWTVIALDKAYTAASLLLPNASGSP